MIADTKTIAGKPVYTVPTTTIINFKSGFRHKLLCDGLTFTCGSACVYRCAFCYAKPILRSNKHVLSVIEHTGLDFQDLVIRRADPVLKVHQVLQRRGRPRFDDPDDKRVIYASPLVDVAATMELVLETVAVCREILTQTHWQIRLLSKSPLIEEIAKRIPAEHQSRMIYGLSTGTLHDGLARAIERGTPLVSRRIQALHRLQDQGLRTFGMICPSLPQDDYPEFSRVITQAIRVDRCEHVWAEVLNARGESMTKTINALRQGGYEKEAARLERVAGDGNAWEAYSRDTFLAHTSNIPAAKLRFLQYPKVKHVAWWREQVPKGAVLLGSAGKPRNFQKSPLTRNSHA